MYTNNLLQGLKNLYSVIKDSDRYIKFVFITGVSKFSRANLLDNFTDITLDKRYAALCGYTQVELENIFQELLGDVPLEQVKEWYNGYNFLGETVYNPFHILQYLDKKEFNNYWFEAGTPSFFIKLIEKWKHSIARLESVALSESSLNSLDIGSFELEALLFQTGYLTIKEIKKRGVRTSYLLKYPNIEVKHSFNDCIDWEKV